MIEFNVNNTPSWALKVIFWRIDFDGKGTYTRDMFMFYDTYRENYYFKMFDGWRMHNLSNYMGIITVWYFKPN
jgi:hypothetical protein